MKKWLVVFFVFDLIFVGLVMYITQKSQRQIAADSNPYYMSLEDGQKKKWDFVKTFLLVQDPTKVVFKSDLIPALCESYQMIELKYVALKVAYAGENPYVKSVFSCAPFRGNNSAIELVTQLSYFTELAKIESHEIKTDTQMHSSHLLFADEEIPTEWRLAEVTVQGESAFTVSTAELDKVHTDRRFYFELISATE